MKVRKRELAVGDATNFTENKNSNKLSNRDRELTLDLFGTDVEVPEEHLHSTPPPPPSEITATQTKKVKKENKGKKLVKKEGTVKLEKNLNTGTKKRKDLVPDDPYAIHGGDITEIKRKPVWFDEEDEKIQVKDVVATMTKARGSRGSQETSEKQYSMVLRDRYYQTIGCGTPDWADLNSKLDDAQDDESAGMKRSTGDYLAKSSSGNLSKSALNYKRVTDLNKASRAEGTINVAQFNHYHPLALVAGQIQNIGTASLFKVDGLTNAKIETIKFPDFPISCGGFLDDRRFIVGCGIKACFYIYDMEVGKETNYPCNYTKNKRNSWLAKNFIVSPDGKLIVFIGETGNLLVYDLKTMSHVDTLQAPEIVTSATFSDSGTKMYTHGENGDVCVWDMVNRACVHRFYDDGCITGQSIALRGTYLACGSSSGVVNVYDTSSISSSISPTPIKSLTRLTTGATTLAFNPSAEILVTASQHAETKSTKLVHLPSFEYLGNFSCCNYSAKPRVASFSPNGGYLTIGTNKATAELYRLYHYSNY